MQTKVATSRSVRPKANLILGLVLVVGLAAPASAQHDNAKANARMLNSTAHRAIFTPSSTGTLEFGKLAVGRAQQDTFYYRNTGTDTLIVYSLELPPDHGFTIQFASLKVAPDGVGKVVVQFAPRETQAYRAALSFVLAKGVQAPTLHLSGTGGAETGLNDRAQLSGAVNIDRSMK